MVNDTFLVVNVTFFSGRDYIFCCGTVLDFLVMWPKKSCGIKFNLRHWKTFSQYELKPKTQTETYLVDFLEDKWQNKTSRHINYFLLYCIGDITQNYIWSGWIKRKLRSFTVSCTAFCHYNGGEMELRIRNSCVVLANNAFTPSVALTLGRVTLFYISTIHTERQHHHWQ